MSTAVRNPQVNTNDEMVIDLIPILLAIKKKLHWLVAAALLAGFLAWLISYLFIVPLYQTNFRVYVNNTQNSDGKTSITSSDLSAARSLATTYAQIISGRTVLTEAAASVGLYTGYGTLKGMVDAGPQSNTEIISVNVRAESPELAVAYAESIIQVAEKQISGIVDGSSMRVIEEPFLPEGIHSPSYVKNTAIGALLAIVAVAGIIALKEIFDTRVRDEESLEQRYGIAILGSVPNYELAGKASNNYGYGKS